MGWNKGVTHLRADPHRPSRALCGRVENSDPIMLHLVDVTGEPIGNKRYAGTSAIKRPKAFPFLSFAFPSGGGSASHPNPRPSTSALTVSSILVIQHPTASSIQYPPASKYPPASSIEHPPIVALPLARTTRDQKSERGRRPCAVVWRGVLSCCPSPNTCKAVFALQQSICCSGAAAIGSEDCEKGRLRVCGRADDSLPRRRHEQNNVESNTADWETCSSHDRNLHRDDGTLLNNATPSIAVDSPMYAVGGRLTSTPLHLGRMITELQPSALTLVRLPFQFFSDA